MSDQGPDQLIEYIEKLQLQTNAVLSWASHIAKISITVPATDAQVVQ